MNKKDAELIAAGKKPMHAPVTVKGKLVAATFSHPKDDDKEKVGK